jgi:hypothetical protein
LKTQSCCEQHDPTWHYNHPNVANKVNELEAFANTSADVSVPPAPANQSARAVLTLPPCTHKNQLHLLFMGML